MVAYPCAHIWFEIGHQRPAARGHEEDTVVLRCTGSSEKVWKDETKIVL